MTYRLEEIKYEFVSLRSYDTGMILLIFYVLRTATLIHSKYSKAFVVTNKLELLLK